ncbi:MAG: hypothetical protein V1698_03410 [bacterium]
MLKIKKTVVKIDDKNNPLINKRILIKNKISKEDGKLKKAPDTDVVEDFGGAKIIDVKIKIIPGRAAKNADLIYVARILVVLIFML